MIKYLRYSLVKSIYSTPVLTNINPNNNSYQQPNDLIICLIMYSNTQRYKKLEPE